MPWKKPISKELKSAFSFLLHKCKMYIQIHKVLIWHVFVSSLVADKGARRLLLVGGYMVWWWWGGTCMIPGSPLLHSGWSIGRPAFPILPQTLSSPPLLPSYSSWLPYSTDSCDLDLSIVFLDKCQWEIWKNTTGKSTNLVGWYHTRDWKLASITYSLFSRRLRLWGP